MAISLHLQDILHLCDPRRQVQVGIMNQGYESPYFEIQLPKISEDLRPWNSIAASSPLERTFIHGRHMNKAAGDMLWLLKSRKIHNFVPILTTESLIDAAISMADIALAIHGLAPSELSEYSKDDLMLKCTKMACSGVFDTARATELLEFATCWGCHVDCNLSRNEGKRAISGAIEYHRSEILDWFIDQRADLNARDDKGNCPLHYMITSGFSSIYPLAKLLDGGANPNTPQTGAFTDNTALHLAIKASKLQETSVLLEKGRADPTLSCGEAMYSALHCAVNVNSLEIVSLVLKYGISQHTTQEDLCNQKDAYGNPPLLLAALHGQTEIAKFLLDAGTNISAVNNDGFNALHSAAIGFHVELVLFFAEMISVNSRTSGTNEQNGQTALHIVTQRLKESGDGAHMCAIALINAGADPTLADSSGLSPLYLIGAIKSSKGEQENHEVRKPLLDLMIQRGVDLDYMSDNIGIPGLLNQAVAQCDVTFVQDILELGASVDMSHRMRKEWTALRQCVSFNLGSAFSQSAALRKVCQIASLLVSKGADIYARDSDGLSLLDHAVVGLNAPMVAFLLEQYKSGSDRTLDKYTAEEPAVNRTQTLKEPTNPFKPPNMLKRLKGVMGASAKQEARVHLLEQRFQNIRNLDRELILDSWQRAVDGEHWDCVCVFLEQDVYGDTMSLKWPVGLKLLKHALDQEVGQVLTLFMGNWRRAVSASAETSKPDPILFDVWNRVRKQRKGQQQISVGARSFNRVLQLIRTKGYTPLLDLASMREKGYVEAQDAEDSRGSLKEVYKVNTSRETPKIYSLFAADPVEEIDELDDEVQNQFNMLLERRKALESYRSYHLTADNYPLEEFYQVNEEVMTVSKGGNKTAGTPEQERVNKHWRPRPKLLWPEGPSITYHDIEKRKKLLYSTAPWQPVPGTSVFEMPDN